MPGKVKPISETLTLEGKDLLATSHPCVLQWHKFDQHEIWKWVGNWAEKLLFFPSFLKSPRNLFISAKGPHPQNPPACLGAVFKCLCQMKGCFHTIASPEVPKGKITWSIIFDWLGFEPGTACVNSCSPQDAYLPLDTSLSNLLMLYSW